MELIALQIVDLFTDLHDAGVTNKTELTEKLKKLLISLNADQIKPIISDFYNAYKHEIAIRIHERKRAVAIAYQFQEDHLTSFASKKSAGNNMAFIEEKISEECRYIGNAISGHNALSASLGYSDEDIIRCEDEETRKLLQAKIEYGEIPVNIPVRNMSMAIVNFILEQGGVSVEKRQEINDKCDSVIHEALRNFIFNKRTQLENLIPETEDVKGKSLEYKINYTVRKLKNANEENTEARNYISIINNELTQTKELLSSDNKDMAKELEIIFLKKWIQTAQFHSDESSRSNVYRNMVGELERLEKGA